MHPDAGCRQHPRSNPLDPRHQRQRLGAGLFVEHEGAARDEVQTLLDTTLSEMIERRQHAFTAEDTLLAEARCTDEPVCALVLAAYRASGWQQ